jgi:hypothetical protein
LLIGYNHSIRKPKLAKQSCVMVVLTLAKPAHASACQQIDDEPGARQVGKDWGQYVISMDTIICQSTNILSTSDPRHGALGHEQSKTATPLHHPMTRIAIHNVPCLREFHKPCELLYHYTTVKVNPFLQEFSRSRFFDAMSFVIQDNYSSYVLYLICISAMPLWKTIDFRCKNHSINKASTISEVLHIKLQ